MARNNMFYWQSDRPYTQIEINDIFLERTKYFNNEQIVSVIERSLNQKVKKLEDYINQGSINLVCPFILSDGFRGVLRAHPPKAKNSYFHVEKMVMDLAIKHNVPTASVLLVDDTRRYADFDFMIMQRVNGIVLRNDLEVHPDRHSSYLRQLGKYLAKLHQIVTTRYGFFDNELAKKKILAGQYSSNQEHYLSALDLDETYHATNDEYFNKDLIRRSFNIIRDNVKTAECQKPVLIHNDVADWNTIVSNGVVTGLMDWDESFSGDPVFEFATLSLFYSEEQMKDILEGYQEVYPLPTDYHTKYPLYTLRYIINKSKIALTKIKYVEKTSMYSWLANANKKLVKIVNDFS